MGPHDLVDLEAAAFLQREADRRHCDVEDLEPMVADVRQTMLRCMQVGIDHAHECDTLVDVTPVGTWDAESDRITQPYPFPPVPFKEE